MQEKTHFYSLKIKFINTFMALNVNMLFLVSSLLVGLYESGFSPFYFHFHFYRFYSGFCCEDDFIEG